MTRSPPLGVAGSAQLFAQGYSEVVWRQDTESFIRCLENAIRHFGGVPQVLNLDNLKAAVLKADWFDPELNPKLAEFCRHYGGRRLPCRPRFQSTRQDGASSEYVKGNALEGRTFPSPDGGKRFLSLGRRRG